MDEITYWIYTKRAPCLMGFDPAVNAQIRPKPSVVAKPPPKLNPPTPEKKRKRKLSVLDESNADEEKQNVYFEDNQLLKRTVLGSCKTVSDSDVEFNIKNSPKPPQNNQLKNGKIANKRKLITSTPQTKTVVRRSSRKLKTSSNNDSPVKETLNGYNGRHPREPKRHSKPLCTEEMGCNGEDRIPNVDTRPSERVTLQFEDISDVSGFTANYIRSTKVLANKSRGNIKNKRNRILIKETKNITSRISGEDNIVNNTLGSGLSEVVNNNSSHNNTLGRQLAKTKSSNRVINRKRNSSKVDPNSSLLSMNSGTSRYPIRNKKITLNNSSDTLEKVSPNLGGVSRTRSGRFIGKKCVDSGSPVKIDTSKGKRRSSWVKTVDSAKKLLNNTSGQSIKKDSVRSKSGFAECFSDSDEDCQPLKQGKFFGV